MVKKTELASPVGALQNQTQISKKAKDGQKGERRHAKYMVRTGEGKQGYLLAPRRLADTSRERAVAGASNLDDTWRLRSPEVEGTRLGTEMLVLEFVLQSPDDAAFDAPDEDDAPSS